MFRRLWFASFLLGAGLVGGCAQQAALTGDVLVPTSSGQAREAANIEVVLVPADADFENSWSALVSQFRSDYDRARSAWHSAWSLYRDASARSQRVSATYLQKFDWATSAEYGDAATLALRAVHQVDESREQIKQVAETYTRLALGAIRARQFLTTRTDANGRYEIRGIPPGRYYVFAGYETFDQRHYWILPTEIGADTVELRLSDENRHWPLLAAAE